MKKTADSALSIMRKILRIANAHDLKFRRIVYFLPETGALRRTSQSLIMELHIMEKYFGHPIFDSMVVVATISSEVYSYAANPESIMFRDGDMIQTRSHFQDALKKVFEDPPEPPIISISLFDTCEEVLAKVQGAKVKCESLKLEFKKLVCARCGMKRVQSKKEDEEETVDCTHPEHLGTIPYDKSTCHPIMIQYTEVQKILGGILHLITLYRFKDKDMWPSFESSDEICAECSKPPLSIGCMRIGSEYPGARGGIVHHTSSATEEYVIEVKGEEVPADQDAEEACCAVGANVYMYQDGRCVFKQEAIELEDDFDVKG